MPAATIAITIEPRSFIQLGTTAWTRFIAITLNLINLIFHWPISKIVNI